MLLSIESGYDPPTVDVSNSAFNRLNKLLSYLHARNPDEAWDEYLAGDEPRGDRIAFAGHPQGGGHAATMAKVNEVTREIRSASAIATTAPWRMTMRPSIQTARGRRRTCGMCCSIRAR